MDEGCANEKEGSNWRLIEKAQRLFGREDGDDEAKQWKIEVEVEWAGEVKL